jgi:hypothetical protein
MKKLAIWTATILVLLGVAGVVGYQMILSGDPTDPEGMYSSYEFFAHDEGDVLEFQNGTVTLRTCCGNDDYGTYRKEKDGTWIWTKQLTMTTISDRTPRKTAPLYFILHPAARSLTIERTDDPSLTLTMGRRLFKKYKL